MLRRPLIHRCQVFDDKTCVPFPGSDKTVVQRTQQSLYTLYKQRPVQFRPYFIAQSITAIVGLMMVAFFGFTLSRCAYGRKLLLKVSVAIVYGIQGKMLILKEFWNSKVSGILYVRRNVEEGSFRRSSSSNICEISICGQGLVQGRSRKIRAPRTDKYTYQYTFSDRGNNEVDNEFSLVIFTLRHSS